MRVPQVQDFLPASELLDLGNICDSVILSHLGPIIQPELIILCRQRVVDLTVGSASVVTKPDIEASIVKLQGKRNAFTVGPEPGGCVTT